WRCGVRFGRGGRPRVMRRRSRLIFAAWTGWRRRGVGCLFVRAAERWAAACGRVEFASDCEAENEASILFYRRLGFAVADTLVHFRRAIPPEGGGA
ncbi:MAG: GNAT family N-acetyltransferase, partial [Spartobacteria bacterium]